MGRGFSIHIGANYVDATAPHYRGISVPRLNGCVNDAAAMADFARARGFGTVECLIDAAATGKSVLDAVRRAAAEVGSGDTFLLTFAGTGTRLPSEEPGDPGPPVWLLYDRMFLEEELGAALTMLRRGAHVVVMADTAYGHHRLRRNHVHGPARSLDGTARMAVGRRFSDLPHRTVRSVDWVSQLDASVTWISACQDTQTALDGDVHGVFTRTLLEVCAAREGQESYPAFVLALRNRMPDSQLPGYAYIAPRRLAPSGRANLGGTATGTECR